ncbi:16S rRNA (cytosine(1402)-N(4))-methyltransferase, partial [bacterium]|nr:16S rRNA (cytosine(1402)-N(4))-methyltransferase [bacterium]
MDDFPHVSVLLREVVESLDPQPEDRILDVTLGLAGHALELIKVAGSKGSLVGLDADEENLTKAKAQLVQYADQSQFVHANFS